MPYDDEEPPYVEPDWELNDLSSRIIGAAIEVHRRLGPGLDEALYHAAMCIELRFRNIPFTSELDLPVNYRNQTIGHKRLDLLVADKIVVELKAIEQIAPVHKAQLLTYLKLTKLKLGLLINFNTVVLKDGLNRIINNN